MDWQSLKSLRQKIAANWLTLFSGSTVGSILTLLSFILMSRTISVEAVGIVAVVQTYWRTIEGFLSFDSFQVTISLGMDALTSGDHQGLMSVIRICFVADIVVALIGAAVGIGGVLLFADSMHIPVDFKLLAIIGAVQMVSMITSPAQGILRLFDRFYIVAGREAFASLARFIATAIGFFAGFSAQYFLAAWIFAELIGNLALIVFGLLTLRQKGYRNLIPRGGEPARMNRWMIIRSLFTVNLWSMIRIFAEEGDVLLVNAMLGPAAAGKYRVAKNFAGILHKVAGPLYGAIYPEVARLIFERSRSVFLRLFHEVNLGAAAMALAAILPWYLLGDHILRWTVGEAYLDTLPTIYVFTLAYAVFFSGFATRPALLAFQRLRAHVAIGFACTLTFFVVAVVLLPRIGYIGAAWGQLVSYVVETGLSIWVVLKAVKAFDWSAKITTAKAEKPQPKAAGA